MSAFVRWLKFNAVGALGMGVQLGALAAINRAMPGHYLLASAAALELTLIHNFIWHVRYTWRDRRGGATRPHSRRIAQFVRFHVANGAVSLAGNLALMRLLVEGARLPVVAANAIAIVVCSIANFCLGNSWAFPEPHRLEA